MYIKFRSYIKYRANYLTQTDSSKLCEASDHRDYITDYSIALIIIVVHITVESASKIRLTSGQYVKFNTYRVIITVFSTIFYSKLWKAIELKNLPLLANLNIRHLL